MLAFRINLFSIGILLITSFALVLIGKDFFLNYEVPSVITINKARYYRKSLPSTFDHHRHLHTSIIDSPISSATPKIREHTKDIVPKVAIVVSSTADNEKLLDDMPKLDKHKLTPSSNRSYRYSFHRLVYVMLLLLLHTLSTVKYVSAADVPQDPINTPSKESVETTSKFRDTFNKEVLGINSDGEFVDKARAKSSKVFSQSEYRERLRICDDDNWGAGNLDDMDADEKAKYRDFRREHKTNGNNWRKAYAVVEKTKPVTNTKYKALLKKEKGKDKLKDDCKEVKPRRLVVPIVEIFDTIHECHQSVGHKGIGATFSKVSKKYSNITEELCIKFINLCPVCLEQQPTIAPQKGAARPIRTDDFRDRFQVDLIDMRTKRKKNIYGVEMRWIMTVKDHSTGLTWLVALPFKQPKFVAHELDIIFGLIGYPTIFHTDNGTEFTASEIVALLKELNPSIQTVTGRVRKPSDQGSVENMNKHVQKTLKRIESEVRQSGKIPNWTSLLGRVMAALNKAEGKGKDNTSAYHAVFGQEYDPVITATTADIRKCRTIEERLALAPDSRLEDSARKMGALAVEDNTKSNDGEDADVARCLSYKDNHWEWEEEGAEKDDPDIIDDVMNVDDEGNDTDNDMYVDDEGKDTDKASPDVSDGGGCEDGKVKSTQEQVASSSTPTSTTATAEAPSKKKSKKKATSFDTSMATTKKQPPKQPPKKQPLSSISANKKKSGWIKLRRLYTAEEAWEQDKVKKVDSRSLSSRRTKKYNFVYATLQCPSCCITGSHTIVMGDEEYLSDSQFTRRWYDFDFISGFAALVAHEAHLESHNQSLDFTTSTQLVHCLHPHATPEVSSCYNLNEDTDKIVSVLHAKQHYSVLVGDTRMKTISIYDGLYYDLDTWQMHVVNVLKCSKLVDRLATAEFVQEPNDIRSFDIIVKIGNEEWRIRSGYSQKQVDSFNCGPIACFKIMEIFNCLEYRMETYHKDTKLYRVTVIEAYKRLVKKYNSDLNVTVPVYSCDMTNESDSESDGEEDPLDGVDCFCMFHYKKWPSMIMSCCDRKMHKGCVKHWLETKSTCAFCREDVALEDIQALCDSASAEEAVSLTPVRASHLEQKIHRSKKRSRQGVQAKKMKALHKKTMSERGVGIGAVVTVKNDYRDVSNALGQVGVVFDWNEDTGDVQIVSSSGIISQGTRKTAYWIPRDRYKVMFKPDETGVLSNDLDDIRAKVVGGTFVQGDYPKVSLQTAHKATVGESPRGKTHGCRCKDGKCTASCGCRRPHKKVPCDSSCSCNGNCDNPLNDKPMDN